MGLLLGGGVGVDEGDDGVDEGWRWLSLGLQEERMEGVWRLVHWMGGWGEGRLEEVYTLSRSLTRSLVHRPMLLLQRVFSPSLSAATPPLSSPPPFPQRRPHHHHLQPTPAFDAQEQVKVKATTSVKTHSQWTNSSLS